MNKTVATFVLLSTLLVTLCSPVFASDSSDRYRYVTLTCKPNNTGFLKILKGFFKSGLNGTNIQATVSAKKVGTASKISIDVSSLAGVATAYTIAFTPTNVLGSGCVQSYDYFGRFRLPYVNRSVEVKLGRFPIPGYYQ